MALLDFIRRPKSPQKRRPYRKRMGPQTPQEAQQLGQARLTSEIYSGKRKMEGVDLTRIGMAHILRDVAPNGDVGELLATIDILQDPEKRARYSDAYLARIEAGDLRHRRKGKGDEEPMSEFEQFLAWQDMMEDMEDRQAERREERRRHNRSDDTEPMGGFERVLDNLTAPGGVLARLMEQGIGLAPMIAAAQRNAAQPQAPKPVIAGPSHMQLQGATPQPVVTSSPEAVGSTATPADNIVAPTENHAGDDMYRSLVLKLVSLFDTTIAPHDAAVNAWQVLSLELASVNMLQRVVLGSAIGSILDSDAAAIIGMMQSYKADAEIGSAVTELESNLPWLTEFLQHLHEIWYQASERESERAGE